MCGMDYEEKRRKQQGERLKAARRKCRYKSAREAALANGWAESTYRAHEGGTRTIGQDDAERYAKRFGVSASSILFGDGAGESSEASQPESGEELSPDDRRFLSEYADLTPDQKIALRSVIAAMKGGSPRQRKP